MKYAVTLQDWPIAGDGFTISRETKKTAQVVHVRLEHDGIVGEGEAVPLKRYGHTPEAIHEQIQAWCGATSHWTRAQLAVDLPPGPARNALDCALWHMMWQQSGLTYADFFHLERKTLATAFTLSGAAPEVMAGHALRHAHHRWLKLKLMGDGQDAERVKAIHQTVPQTELLVDANEALTIESLQALLPVLQANNVVLIEQPLPSTDDDALRGFMSPIPLAADESCHSMADLPRLQGKYQVVNLKLDKTGGLTHAMEMAKAAREMGFQLMVGCMASTSLAILPACILAQQAAFIDLDGALLLQKDRIGLPISYDSGQIFLL